MHKNSFFYSIFFSVIFLLLFASLSEEKPDNDLAYEWGSKALKICKEMSKTRKLRKKCETFQEIVEEMFDSFGVQMAEALEKDPVSVVTKRSRTEPWKSAGVKKRIFSFSFSNSL